MQTRALQCVQITNPTPALSCQTNEFGIYKHYTAVSRALALFCINPSCQTCHVSFTVWTLYLLSPLQPLMEYQWNL